MRVSYLCLWCLINSIIVLIRDVFNCGLMYFHIYKARFLQGLLSLSHPENPQGKTFIFLFNYHLRTCSFFYTISSHVFINERRISLAGTVTELRAAEHEGLGVGVGVGGDFSHKSLGRLCLSLSLPNTHFYAENIASVCRNIQYFSQIFSS